MHVVRDEERAIWSDNEPRRPERCTTGIFRGVGKDDVGAVCLAIGEWLEQDVIASLRPGGSVPGAVERNEGTALIGFWESLAEIDLHIVGRPMGRKERDWPLPLGADTDLLAAIAAVLRPEHQFSLCVVEIAFGPAVIRALPQFDNLFSRQILTLLCGIKLRPVLAELVPSMLRDEDAAGGVKREPLAVAQAAGVSLGRRKALVGLVGVIAPDTGTSSLLGAGIVPRRMGEPIPLLAIVGSRAKINEEIAFRCDQERMHRMVADNGQVRHHRLPFALGCDLVGRDRVAHDAVVGLGVDHAVMEYEAGATVAAARDRFTEPFDDVGVPVAMRVLQRDNKATRWNGAVVEIGAAPRVDVERSVRRDCHLAGVADVVRENCGAEAVGQSDAGRLALATRGCGLGW